MSESKAKRHAVVTGGGRGIGAAIAAELAKAGVEVSILGRSEAPLKAQVAAGAAARYALADVTDADALARAFHDLEAAAGPIDILVNNAGTVETAPFLKAGTGSYRRMIDVHLLASVEAAGLVLPGMVERKWGRIVNIASTASLKGFAYVGGYCAAKHALLGFTRALAVEVAKQGVTVNAVCPGYTHTDMVDEGLAKNAARTGKPPEELLQTMLRANPMSRLILPAEVASAVAWLVSEGAAAVNGQAIAVDGGETIA